MILLTVVIVAAVIAVSFGHGPALLAFLGGLFGMLLKVCLWGSLLVVVVPVALFLVFVGIVLLADRIFG